jgi:hypothetical protein
LLLRALLDFGSQARASCQETSILTEDEDEDEEEEEVDFKVALVDEGDDETEEVEEVEEDEEDVLDNVMA